MKPAESRHDSNRRAREQRSLAQLRRFGLLLELAAVDPIVDGDAGEECFFCEQRTTSGGAEQHAPECLWRRVNFEQHGIRSLLTQTVEATTYPEIKNTALAILRGDLHARVPTQRERRASRS